MKASRFASKSFFVAMMTCCFSFTVLLGTVGCPASLRPGDGEGSQRTASQLVGLFENSNVLIRTSDCTTVQQTVTTGSGSANLSADPRPSNASVTLELTAPKGTDSTATSAACGLVADFEIVTGNPQIQAATGRITCFANVVVLQGDVDDNGQGGEEAGGYFIPVRLSATELGSTKGLGENEIEYCRLEPACSFPLPDDGGFIGNERLVLEVNDIRFEAGKRYGVGVSLGGGITSSEFDPELGGKITVALRIVQLEVGFDD